MPKKKRNSRDKSSSQKEKKLDWHNFNFLENMLIFCTVPERKVPKESGLHFSVSSTPEDQSLIILFKTDRRKDPLIREKNVSRPDYTVSRSKILVPRSSPAWERVRAIFRSTDREKPGDSCAQVRSQTGVWERVREIPYL